jgi:hypothetical protein
MIEPYGAAANRALKTLWQEKDRCVQHNPKKERRMRTIAMIGTMMILGLLQADNLTALAYASERPETAAVQGAIGRTPPRLSFIKGQVSFWRPGADDWTQAQINTPVAPGDQLFTGAPGNLELQIGTRAFVRASDNTLLSLDSQEPDFLLFKVTSGVVAFDLRTVEPGRTLEVNTPHASYIVERAGYYRMAVDDDSTSLIARRSGEAAVRLPGGDTFRIASGEHVVVEGTDTSRVTAAAAPALDGWDKWNYARTDRVLEAVSSRYVSQDIYGVADLDRAGRWQVVPTYGAVWVPYGVPSGWAPYSAGAWVRDPYYGWTWVDAAPWGWAPYHYGRWVFVGGHWAWAPGPRVARPLYCPALVAFFGVHGGSIGVSVSSGPLMAWVALGWGEPVIPWWGPPHFRYRPCWSGWHGPHIVNKVVVHHTTVVHTHHLRNYHNARVRHGVVAVQGKHFGRGPITRDRLYRVNDRDVKPAPKLARISTRSENYMPNLQRGNRPADPIMKRSVVSRRSTRASKNSKIRNHPNHTMLERSASQPGRPAPPTLPVQRGMQNRTLNDPSAKILRKHPSDRRQAPMVNLGTKAQKTKKGKARAAFNQQAANRGAPGTRVLPAAPAGRPRGDRSAASSLHAPAERQAQRIFSGQHETKSRQGWSRSRKANAMPVQTRRPMGSGRDR